MNTERNIGLYIIGDEILSGRREDKHLRKVIELLTERGLELSWAKFLPDDLNFIASEFKQSLAREDIVFSCGGIGATPDDKTRQAMAEALGVPLALHPEARDIMNEAFAEAAKKRNMPFDPTSPENMRRLNMGVFPEGAEIVENPFNRIPGFHIKDHTFVPGFPEMAWAMIENTLDTRYAELARSSRGLQSFLAYHLPESAITPALEEVEKTWPGVSTFSLPRVAQNGQPGYIELGVKGPDDKLEEALALLKKEALNHGGTLEP